MLNLVHHYNGTQHKVISYASTKLITVCSGLYDVIAVSITLIEVAFPECFYTFIYQYFIKFAMDPRASPDEKLQQ